MADKPKTMTVTVGSHHGIPVGILAQQRMKPHDCSVTKEPTDSAAQTRPSEEKP